jgi:hypothetical protein
MLFKFKNLSEADFVKGDIWGGEVEYEGEIYKFLCDLIICACNGFYSNPGDFNVGEIFEINENDLVTDHFTYGYPSDQPCITNF